VLAITPGRKNFSPADQHGPELIRKNHRLQPGNLESLSAAHVLAAHYIVFAQHVGAGFGKAGAIAFIGAAGELALLGSD
jgi:hypothetical protein